MDLYTTQQLLAHAQHNNYAIGAFNVFNIESAQAVARAAKQTQSPVVIQITQSTMKYAGARTITNATLSVITEELGDNYPVALHLDHGKSLEIAQSCIDMGFSSVMYDGSRHPYEENSSVTQSVVQYAHAHGVSVQAELGSVLYSVEQDSDSDVDWDQYMTDPEKARDFVMQTGCDTLAVAIGNAHGFMPERPEPDFDRLAQIRAQIDVPIVLHGASDWEEDRARRAISNGVSCFNVDTYSRVAFTEALQKYFAQSEVLPKPRKFIGSARDAMQEAVMAKMYIFGSGGHVSDF